MRVFFPVTGAMCVNIKGKKTHSCVWSYSQYCVAILIFPPSDLMVMSLFFFYDSAFVQIDWVLCYSISVDFKCLGRSSLKPSILTQPFSDHQTSLFLFKIFVYRCVSYLGLQKQRTLMLSSRNCSAENGKHLNLNYTGQHEKKSAFISVATVCFKRALYILPALG